MIKTDVESFALDKGAERVKIILSATKLREKINEEQAEVYSSPPV